MGIPCVGIILALDAERALDIHFMDILQPLPPCEIAAVVGGEAACNSGHCGLRGRIIHLSRRESSDEELAQLLNESPAQTLSGILPLAQDSHLVSEHSDNHAPCRRLYHACQTGVPVDPFRASLHMASRAASKHNLVALALHRDSCGPYRKHPRVQH